MDTSPPAALAPLPPVPPAAFLRMLTARRAPTTPRTTAPPTAHPTMTGVVLLSFALLAAPRAGGGEGPPDVAGAGEGLGLGGGGLGGGGGDAQPGYTADQMPWPESPNTVHVDGSDVMAVTRLKVRVGEAGGFRVVLYSAHCGAVLGDVQTKNPASWTCDPMMKSMSAEGT
eukprot:Amastigsp_a842419_14.p3 type:complete len:171 gc:universal Amastigsp_a842419_14:139-651(+)